MEFEKNGIGNLFTNGNRDTGVQNKHMDTKGEKEGEWDELGHWN